MNFLGSLGFGSLSWCEIDCSRSGAGAPFSDCLPGSSCLGGEHAHAFAGTPQIQSNLAHSAPIPAPWGAELGVCQNCPSTTGMSGQVLAKLQGQLALTGAVDSPGDEHQGLFGQALHPWVQGDDAPLGSVCWMGHLLLKERGMSLKYCRGSWVTIGEGCRDIPKGAQGCSGRAGKCPGVPGTPSQSPSLLQGTRAAPDSWSCNWPSARLGSTASNSSRESSVFLPGEYQPLLPASWQGASSASRASEAPAHPSRGKKHHSPSMGLAWAAAVWGSLIPLAPWQWWGSVAQRGAPAGHGCWGGGGDHFAHAGAPLKSKALPAAAGPGFGWRPCEQPAMDSRWPAGARASPRCFFGSWAARGVPSKGNIRQKAAGRARRRRKRRRVVLFPWLQAHRGAVASQG